MAVGLVIVGSAFGFWLLNKDDQSSITDGSSDATTSTQTEDQPSNQSKDNIPQNQTDNTNSTSSNTGTKKSVSPVMTVSQSSAGANVKANGYVPGIVEQGGKCTLTLTKGSDTVNQSGNAFNDAQSTNCGLLEISRTQLTSGTWQAVLSYSSSKSAGNSSPANIEVK